MDSQSLRWEMMTKIWGCILLVCCAVWGQELPTQMGLRSFLAPGYPDHRRA